VSHNRRATLAICAFGLLGLVGCGNDDESPPQVSGNCSAGSFVTAIGTNGTVTCGSAEGDITAVSAGSGLAGGGTSGAVTLSVDTTVVQSRVAGICTPGSFVTAVNANGTVTCEGVVAAVMPSGSASAAQPAGVSFVYPATVATMSTPAACLVSASAQLVGPGTGFAVRPIVANAANLIVSPQSWGYAQAFSVSGANGITDFPVGSGSGFEASSTAVMTVTGAGPYRFGCEINGAGQTGIRCNVAYSCR
jgi:hypothetical protein